MKLRFFVDRMHDPLTLETWQFRSVAEGRVSRDALMLYLAVQAVGREGREADMDAIGKALQLEPKACLDMLLAAGWILESKGGWRMPAPRVAGAVTLSKDEPPKAPAEPVAASAPALGLGATTTRPRKPRKKKTPDAPGADATAATPSPPMPPIPDPEPVAPELVALTRWVEDLTGRLIEAYPHGVTENGLERPAPRQPIKNKLLAIMRPLDPGERDVLAVEVLRGAALMREAYGDDLDQRKFVPMLMTWVNQRRWESPPRAPRGGRSSAERLDQRAQARDHERRVEGYVPASRGVDPKDLEEARRRREQAVRDAHRTDVHREEAGHR